jgi:hypothetical protein
VGRRGGDEHKGGTYPLFQWQPKDNSRGSFLLLFQDVSERAEAEGGGSRLGDACGKKGVSASENGEQSREMEERAGQVG